MLQYGYKIGKLDYDKEKYKEMILDGAEIRKVVRANECNCNRGIGDFRYVKFEINGSRIEQKLYM